MKIRLRKLVKFIDIFSERRKYLFCFPYPSLILLYFSFAESWQSFLLTLMSKLWLAETIPSYSILLPLIPTSCSTTSHRRPSKAWSDWTTNSIRLEQNLIFQFSSITSGLQVSISSTIYTQLFCTKVLCEAFL